MVQELAKVGIIRPAHSLYNSPIWPVWKSDGTWRMMVDYWELNKVTPPINAAILNIVSLMDTLSREIKTYHYVLDLANVFFSIQGTCSRNVWMLCRGTWFSKNHWWWANGWTGWSCGSFPTLAILWFYEGNKSPGREGKERELTFRSVFRTDPKLHWCLTSVHNKHYKKQAGMCSLASLKQQLLMLRNTEGNRAESGKAHMFSWNGISNFHFWRQNTKLVQTYSSSKRAFLWCYGHTKTFSIEKCKDSKIQTTG